MKRPSAAWAVLAGGSIGGTLDILFAISFAACNGAPPSRLLQTVASGLLGDAAFSGGIPAAALGLLLHFCISYLWAGIFLGAARYLPGLVRKPILSGTLFGIAVFFTMRLVVLPLSAFPYPVSFKPLATTLDLLSHTLLFGVPIALAARRACAVVAGAGLTDFATRYAAAWSSQDPASLASFYAPDGSLTVNEGAPSVGRAAITATAQGFMTAFPDMVVRLDGVSEDGSHAIFRWIWTGTNTGPGGTGKSVRIKGYEDWIMGADGLIVESRGHYDEAEYQRQLRSGAPPTE